MVRLYLHSPFNTGKKVFLQDSHIHYVRHVLRLREESTLRLFNAQEGEWQGQIERLTKSQGIIKIGHQLKPPVVEPGPNLAFAPLKQLHYLLEKATEMGVQNLFPILTEYTQVHKMNQDKMKGYCIEAAQQCERLSIPPLSPPQRLHKALLSWSEENPLIVCAERQVCLPLPTLLKTIPPSPNITFLIGPEGGFSPQDREILSQYSFVHFCHMGPRIMRAETAAIAALSCYQSLKGDWKERSPFL